MSIFLTIIGFLFLTNQIVANYHNQGYTTPINQDSMTNAILFWILATII